MWPPPVENLSSACPSMTFSGLPARPRPPLEAAMRLKSSQHRDPGVEAYLAKRDDVPGQTARWLTDLVRNTVPDSQEAIYHRSPKFCLPDGTVFCYVATFTHHADLGFIEGAQMEDPDGLLEGTGKGLRHVKVTSVDAIAKAKLVKLVKAAARRARTKEPHAIQR